MWCSVALPASLAVPALDASSSWTWIVLLFGVGPRCESRPPPASQLRAKEREGSLLLETSRCASGGLVHRLASCYAASCQFGLLFLD